MRIATPLSFLLLTACGPKTPPVATADAPVETETETEAEDDYLPAFLDDL